MREAEQLLSEEATLAETATSRNLPAVELRSGDIIDPRRGVAEVVSEHARIPWYRRLRLLSFLALVAAPTVAWGAYLTFFASYAYTSEFRVAVRSVEPMQMMSFSSILGLGNLSQSAQGANAIVQYLRSRKAVEDVDKSLGVRAFFSSPSVDYLSRLHDDGEIEKLVRYWQRMIDAYYETSTATIIVRVTAFSGEQAYSIATETLKLSEKLVNEMSERARRDTVAVAESGVAKSKTQLTAATDKLRDLRNRYNIIDPKLSAESISGLFNKIRQDLINKRVIVETMQKSLDPDAPSLIEAQAQLRALERQTEALGGEATKGDGSRAPILSTAISSFEQATSELDFATKFYESELAALKQAEIEAGRQQLYLATIVPPEPPEEASFPRPALGTLKVFLVALALWLVGAVAVSAVREHR
jgi:capsular polysaccharide transport system permease protein